MKTKHHTEQNKYSFTTYIRNHYREETSKNKVKKTESDYLLE